MPPANGSTGSHRPPPASGSSLSDLLRSNAGLPRRASSSDLAAHLLGSAGSNVVPPPVPDAAGGGDGNTDDAPTVITQNRTHPPPVAPPHVVGEAPTLAGRTLGHFELIEAIGAGGMAAVLKARDQELGRVVALKILPPESARDPEGVTRFKQEARAAAKLDHENVARVYFCGEDQGLHFIAFEFVEGSTLRALIDRRGKLPAGECVGYMIQLAAGLAHASERGVVHRDIKPSNIIITPGGRAKIVDMGLARHLDANPANGGVTQSGVTLGTFDYISPEQALDPRRADVRSDLYSLGCTFYHALTARPPVPEGTAAKKLYAHQHTEPLDPRLLNPAIPDGVAAVLSKLMAKDPTRRYQTPASLIADLKRLVEPLGTTDFTLSDSVVRAIPASESVLPRPPRVPVGAALVAAGLLVAVAALAVTSGGGSPSPAVPPWAANGGGGKKAAVVPQPSPDRPPAGTPKGSPARRDAADAPALAAALADPKTTRVRLTGRDYDLTELPEAVLFTGRALELVGNADRPPTVRVAAVPLDPGRPGRQGSLTFAGAASVSVQGVRFETVPPVEAGGEAGPAGVGVAAVDVADFKLADCVFGLADRRLLEGAACVGVVRKAGPAANAQVRLDRCVFLPGEVGLRVGPRVDVAAEDCGFAALDAGVQIEPDAAPSADAARPAAVKFDRSSFFLDGRSAAVDAGDPAADVKVSAGYCVFAPTGPTVDPPPVPGAEAPRHGAVLRVPKAGAEGVRFGGVGGRRNAHYRVDAVAAGDQSFPYDDKGSPPVPFDDKEASALARRPWEAGDVAALLADPDRPQRAFGLRVEGPDAEAALFAADRAVALLGAQFVVREGVHRAYPDRLGWPPDAPGAAGGAKLKVWWPEAPAEGSGVYTSLERLLYDLRSGDTVLVRHDGPVMVEPQTVKYRPARGATPDMAADFAVTFRPFEGCKPVLTFAASRAVDAALFKLEDGTATFEGLHFKVRAGKAKDMAARTAVSVLTGRGCTFKACVFTLEEDEARASAVTVADAERVMVMDPATGKAPRIRFEDCLVRGKGRMLWVPASRPFDLECVNGLTALDGPLVAVDPAGREVDRAAGSRVAFTGSTALLGGPVVDLAAGGKAGDPPGTGLVTTHVTADGCLFAAVPGAGRPLVELDGIDPADAKDVLSWQADRKADARPTWYANWGETPPAVFNVPGDDGVTPKPWDWDAWLRFAGEVGRPVGTVRFAAPPAGVKALAGVVPADAAVKGVEFPDLAAATPGDSGADPGRVAKPE